MPTQTDSNTNFINAHVQILHIELSFKMTPLNIVLFFFGPRKKKISATVFVRTLQKKPPVASFPRPSAPVTVTGTYCHVNLQFLTCELNHEQRLMWDQFCSEPDGLNERDLLIFQAC